MLDLSNPILYELGLVSAIRALLESKFLPDQGIQGKLTACQERLDLEREIRITLYQAVNALIGASSEEARDQMPCSF